MSSKDKPLWRVTFKNMDDSTQIHYQVRASNADNAAGEGWAVLKNKFPDVASLETLYNILRIARDG